MPSPSHRRLHPAWIVAGVAFLALIGAALLCGMAALVSISIRRTPEPVSSETGV